ncbi:Gfo/Idh/MocA family protein [Streptomyces corynorhini]|uniref:Gfo/Idh/MocA family oxidoreductase n=1 Tax=Streptomyces corynorhini TaxID=2282652 RepID=A0A370B292_9ACTN|nr:Gfo/Idh/MocA family oxidoreductase [Streptomyces corynorhini]RDG33973.1 gfo/Idh/MocA family oxidoreductase [Streptomyces corynorhini]
MRRVLLVGAGEVGTKHLGALAGVGGMTVVGVADPSPDVEAPAGVPLLTRWQNALPALGPDLVVVATPPGIALEVARAAARGGATVLVEKPVTLDPAALAEPDPADGRIYVAFQPHFAHGLRELLELAPVVHRAEVTLICRRDQPYYRTWRTRMATSGGVLHQQAIHGLALALRLLPSDPVTSCTARIRRERKWAESEDHVTAHVSFEDGAVLTIDARVDGDQTPRHEVALVLADGQRLHIRGRNLEAGLGRSSAAPTDQTLRHAMYRALPAPGGRPVHPCLFPLPALRRSLEVIDHVYRAAHQVRPADSAA